MNANAITARALPFFAIAGGLAVLVTIASLAPAEGYSRYRAPAPEPTRIEVDKSANAIRFYIEGQQVAVIDAEGLSR